MRFSLAIYHISLMKQYFNIHKILIHHYFVDSIYKIKLNILYDINFHISHVTYAMDLNLLIKKYLLFCED